MVLGCFAPVMKMNISIMERCIGENVLMNGHGDEKTQWFKYMMKELFKQKFEVEEICLCNLDECNNKRRDRSMKKNIKLGW